MNTKLILGSIAGAVAIHVAFLACGKMSTATGDGGILNSMTDAMNAVVSDAHAGDDSGVAACLCPELPKPAETTFSLRVDRGDGPEEPMADYSTAGVGVTPAVFEDGSAGVTLSAFAIYYTHDSARLSLTCWVNARLDRSIVSGTAKCGSPQTDVAGADVSVLTENTIEFRIPSYSYRAGDKTISYAGIVFRTRNPSGHFLTPPRAYVP